MTENQSEQEPSIEEILASIRQIISDDDEEVAADSEENASEEDEDSVADPIRHESNDVLELTEDDLVEDVMPEPEPEKEMEVEMVDSTPAALPAKEEIDADLQAIREQAEAEKNTVPSEILSSAVQASAMNSLSKLTKGMPIDRSRSYDGVTLEDIVRELLHPMLREWMDDNLPRMVERIVQKEVEKLARRAIDD